MMPELELEADCTRCVGLCCVALGFAASADFAIDKAAGEACPHLQTDFRCAVHTDLRGRGFAGCSVYDCLGAGQHVSQVIFAGSDWRSDSAIAQQMFALFPRMQQLHELLWYLREALQLQAVRTLRAKLRAALDEIVGLSGGTPESLLALDLAETRRGVTVLLRRASELARRDAPGPHVDHTNADLIGARLAGADLRAASLRGAQLVAADLRGADLRLADLTAADTRNADLCGADLSTALFVRQSQLDAARGDAITRIPARLRCPAHWLVSTLPVDSVLSS
jgi:uncharacterized protein YjbI with pentapeptide repeats